MRDDEVLDYLQAEENAKAKEEQRKRRRIRQREARQLMRETAEALGMSMVRGSVSGRYYME